MDWPRLVLPTPGGPREAQHRARPRGVQFADRQELDQPALHPCPNRNGRGPGSGARGPGRGCPRSCGSTATRTAARGTRWSATPRCCSAGRRGRRRSSRSAYSLTAGGHLRRLDLPTQFRRLLVEALFAEFLADGPHLFAQVGAALGGGDMRGHILVDLPAQAAQFSSWSESSTSTARTRRGTSRVSSKSCFWAVVSGRLAAIRSASWPGSSRPRTRPAVGGGSSGVACTYCRA